MCNCDFEYPKVSSFLFRNARKIHTCDDCRKPIAVGESYRIDKGFLDEWYQFKSCDRCLTLAWFLTKEDPAFCFHLGGLQECLGESDFAFWDDELGTYTDLPEGIKYTDRSFIPDEYLCKARAISEAIDELNQRDACNDSILRYRSKEVDRAIEKLGEHE